MHQVFTTWKITCCSDDDALLLQQWLANHANLDRVFTDVIRVVPDGMQQSETKQHRLGDYFASIELMTDVPLSFRLVFQCRPDCGSFWKDFMVNILQEMEATFPQSSILLESKKA